MSTLFPTALDTGTSLPNPATSSTLNSPSHAGLHDTENAAIIATETKIGTGSSTPAANTLLLGTGTGTSAWSSLTSATLAASVSDETGTGSLVFANTPSLITPKVDTINESTTSNGVTVSGVNLKSGVVTTTGYASSTALQTNAVQGNQLATSAITLGYAQITSNPTNLSSTSPVQVAGLTTTVTIPAGGRKIEITAFISFATAGASQNIGISIWDGVVGSGTKISEQDYTVSSGGVAGFYVSAVVTPSAGSKTYNVAGAVSTNAATIAASTTAPAYILVKAI